MQELSIQKERKTFPGIDIIKFIMAVFVVGIHTHPFEGIKSNIATFWKEIILLAVPFFFIASGYLLFLKVYKTNNKETQLNLIKKYAKRIIEIYLIWTIIYLPITIWWFVNNGVPFQKDLMGFLRALFFIGENYYSWPLWYLLSLFYSLVIIYVLKKLSRKDSFILIIALVLFFISFKLKYLLKHNSDISFINEIRPQLKFIFNGGRILTGLLYVMIGAFFAMNKNIFSKSSFYLMLLIGVYFQINQESFITDFTFILLPIFVFYLSINIKLKNSSFLYFMRKSSSVMYFTHMLFFFLYTLIFKEFRYFGLDAFIISMLLPILLTVPIIKFENKIPLLKKLF